MRRTPVSRRNRLALLIVAIVGGAGVGCASRGSTAARVVDAPRPVAGRMDEAATEFRRMFLAYIAAAAGDAEVLVEIDPVRNPFNRELPADLSQHVRVAVERIGLPFRTVKAWL